MTTTTLPLEDTQYLSFLEIFSGLIIAYLCESLRDAVKVCLNLCTC